jgi:hypothetical protein
LNVYRYTAVPSIGPVSKHHLIAMPTLDAAALAESTNNKRAWDSLLSKDENSAVGLYKRNAVDPQLESTRFQSLNCI